MEYWNQLKPALRYSKKKRYEYIMNEIHNIDTTYSLILKFKDLPARLRNNEILRFNYIISSLYAITGKDSPSFPWGDLSMSCRMSKIKRYLYIMDLIKKIQDSVKISFRGISGATIRVDDDIAPYNIVDDGDNQIYYFNDLTIGDHTYTVTKVGYEPITKKPFTITTDGESFDFTLVPETSGSSMKVTLLDDDTQLLDDSANVTLTNKTSDKVYTLEYNNNGYYETKVNVEPGRYTLKCVLSPFTPYQDDTIELHDGENTTNVEFKYIDFKVKHADSLTSFKVLSIDGDLLTDPDADGYYTKTLNKNDHEFRAETHDYKLHMIINPSREYSKLVFDFNGVMAVVSPMDDKGDYIAGANMRLADRLNVAAHPDEEYVFTCVPLGEQRLIAKKDGYKDFNTTVTVVDEGGQCVLTVTMEKKEACVFTCVNPQTLKF